MLQIAHRGYGNNIYNDNSFDAYENAFNNKFQDNYFKSFFSGLLNGITYKNKS